MLKITITKKLNKQKYFKFLKNIDRTLFYHSYTYMNVLEKYLKGNLVFIICYKKTDIIALLPLIKKRGKYGFVYNSLPFFAIQLISVYSV